MTQADQPQHLTARERCYAEIVNVAPEALARYYAEYPERLLDERAREAQAWSVRGMKRILLILDKYEITDIPNRAQPTPKPSRLK
jgi:hypothetical protein